MFEIGLAKSGGIPLPARRDLTYEFLDVQWRTIQRYGVEIHGQRYNGAALNLHRNHRSPYGGVHAGRWPFFIDAHDVRYVYVQEPDSKVWHRLEWEHAPSLGQPFSQDAADHAKRVSIRQHRHVDPQRAVQDLLAEWSRGEVETRRDRSLARRLSAQRADAALVSGDQPADPDADARQVASLPAVIDLLERRQHKQAGLDVSDDLDVFERYWLEYPGAQELEVFDE